MFNSDSGVVISWKDYYNGAKKKLLEECCLKDEVIQGLLVASKSTPNPDKSQPLAVINVDTENGNNVVGSYTGYNVLYKHVFLQKPAFKKEIIEYYKARGVSWIDIVPMNRIYWKIFLYAGDLPAVHARSSSSTPQNKVSGTSQKYKK